MHLAITKSATTTPLLTQTLLKKYNIAHPLKMLHLAITKSTTSYLLKRY